VRGLLFAGGFRQGAGVPQSSPLDAVSPPRGASVPPALVEQRTATHDNLSFEAQSRGSRTLAVYASQLSFPLSRSYGHARLASGWWPAFTGRGSQPRKVPNEVSVSNITTSSSSKLSQRNQRPSWAAPLGLQLRVIGGPSSTRTAGSYCVQGKTSGMGPFSLASARLAHMSILTYYTLRCPRSTSRSSG
jgi:hypothetical protein